MLKRLLWIRYLKQRRLIFLSVTAVAVSEALLMVVASLFSGFIVAYEKSAESLLGHVLLYTPLPVEQYERLTEALERTDAVAAAGASMYVPGLVHLGVGQVRAVQVWGIEPNSMAEVMALRDFLVHDDPAKSFPTPLETGDVVGGYVGIGLLSPLDEQTDRYDRDLAVSRIGETMRLTMGATSDGHGEGRPSRPRRATLAFRLRDVVFTGNYFFDQESIYLPLEPLYRKLNPQAEHVTVERIHMRLRPGIRIEEAEHQILAAWQTFAQSIGWNPFLADRVQLETAKGLQQRYLAEVRKQMGMLLLVFGIVDLGAVALIFCIFYLIVHTKQRDIAILKACGMSSPSIAQIFLGFGACVGCIGVILGTGIGIGFIRYINEIERGLARAFGFNLWNSSVYVFSKIPNQVDWFATTQICLWTVLAATLGALVPALLAAAVQPVRILRYE